MDEHAAKATDGPQHLGNAISRLIALRGYGQTGSQRQLSEMWRDAVGPEIERQTRVMGLRNGNLSIGVGNAALLSELSAFHKHDLLKKVQLANVGASIRDLKFRLRGDINTDQ